MPALKRFLRRYIAHLWPWFVGGVVFLVATNYISVQIPLELGAAIDTMRASGDRAEVVGHATTVAILGVLVIIVRTLSRVLFFTPSRLAEHELRRDLLNQLMELRPAWYADHTTGDLVSRASNDIQWLRVMVGFGTLQVANVAAALVLTGWKMLALSPKLTAVAAAPIAVGLVGMHLGVRQFARLMTLNQQQLGQISNTILAALQGVRTVAGFNAEERFAAKLDAKNAEYMDTALRMAAIRTLLMPALALAAGLCVYALLAVGGPMAARGDISVGELVAFVALVGYVLMPLRAFGWVVSVFQRGMVSLGRIDEVLATVPDRPEGPQGRLLPAGAPSLSLRGLSFSWPARGEEPERLALSGISVDIPAGAVVGICGRTGSGKTTLLRLLARNFDPPPGTVFVGGEDITKLDLNAWQARLALVPQVPFLFSDSIAANVAMDVASEARVAEAVADAALESDLAMLPDGLRTVVGERGLMLSGGQRQRVALARGLARDYDLLILDDVLSAVDQRTEQLLIDALERVATSGREGRGRPTTLIVSHRVSVLARTDLVLVLEEGRLLDHGTHAELLERSEAYRAAWCRDEDGEAA